MALSPSAPLIQLLSFVGTFLAAGSVGFRYTSARVADLPASDWEEQFFAHARRLAAVLGVVGACVGLGFAFSDLPAAAARAHATVQHFATTDAATALSLILAVVAIAGFSVAAADVRQGWPLAAFGVVGGALAPLAAAKWTSVINPIHRLAAGFWIGTLLVTVSCALTPLLRSSELRERRGSLTAEMIGRFSPLALTMGGLVVAFGLLTAWRHLPTVSSLWETPYGKTLIVKLIAVAIVFALGAFNWRRQRPSLGQESAAISIGRSARMELTIAALVLVVTSVLVSLPSPKRAPPRPTNSASAPTR